MSTRNINIIPFNAGVYQLLYLMVQLLPVLPEGRHISMSKER